MTEATRTKQDSMAGDAKIMEFGKIIDAIQNIEAPLKNIEKNTAVIPKLATMLAKSDRSVASPAPISSPIALPSYYQKATRAVIERKPAAANKYAAPKVELPAPRTSIPKPNATTSLPKPATNRQLVPGQAKNAVLASVVSEAVQQRAVKAKRASTAKPVIDTAPEAAFKRDGKGRFQGSSIAQQAQSDAKDTQRAGEEKKTLIQSIKDGFKTVGGHAAGAVKDGAQSVDTKEAAGQAAGGPLYSAAKELYGAGQDIKEKAQDETTLLGKTWKGIKSKTGIAGGKKDAVVAELKVEEGKEVSRHKELLGAVKAISVTGGSQKEGGGLPGIGAQRSPKSGPGSSRKPVRTPKEKPALKKAIGRTPDGKFNIRTPKTGGVPGGRGGVGGMLMNGLGSLMGGGGMLAGLGSMIGPAIAVAVAGAAGAAIGTGISSLMDKGAQKLTGDKNATAGGSLYDFTHRNDVKGVRDVIGQVESGGKGYSAYQNKDSGVVSAGKYQFTAQGGKDSSLAKVMDNYVAGGGSRSAEAQKYSSIMKSGNAESLRKDPQFKQFIEQTGNDQGMQKAQEKTFDSNYFNPAMGYAQKQGINVAKMPKLAGMMVDAKIQGGMEDVTSRTKARLAAQGKDFKTASEDDIMNIFTDERKQRLERVARSKDAKGDTASASMLRSSKDRVDVVHGALDKNESKLKENAFEMADAARKDGRPATAVAPVATLPTDYEKQKAEFLAKEAAITPQMPIASSPSKKKGKGKGKGKDGTGGVAKSTEEPAPKTQAEEIRSASAEEIKPEAPQEQTGVKAGQAILAPEPEPPMTLKERMRRKKAGSNQSVEARVSSQDKADTETGAVSTTSASAPIVPSPPPVQPPPPAPVTAQAVPVKASAPAMGYDEEKVAREGIQKEYWVKEDARRAQSGEAFKQVKDQQSTLTTEKDAKLADIETRRKAVDAKYDAGGLKDDEAGAQQVALDAEAEQVKQEHLAKTGNAISGGFKSVDAQSGQLLAEKDAKVKALDAQVAGVSPAQATAAPVAVASASAPIVPSPPPVQPPPPAPVTANVPEVGQLAAAMQQNQQASNKKEGTSAVSLASIKTEFDDTMLTLMAYDRV